MPWFSRKKSKKAEIEDARRRRRAGSFRELDRQQPEGLTGQAFVFIILAVLATLICFVGVSPTGIQLLPDRMAEIRVTAEFPFKYESSIQTKRLIEQRKQVIAPIYTIDLEAFNEFQNQITTLNAQIEAESATELATIQDQQQVLTRIEEFNRQLHAEGLLTIEPNDLALLLRETTAEERALLFEESLLVLRDIVRDGVYDASESTFNNESSSAYLPIQILGQRGEPRAQSEEDAVRLLRINLAGLDVSRGLSRALYRVYRNGLEPNLQYDLEKTEQKKNQVAKQVKPVEINVQEGETIIEPDTLITQEQIEKLNSYRKEQAMRDDMGWGVDSVLLEHTVLTFGLMFLSFVWVQTSIPKLQGSVKKVSLVALILLFNLIIFRLISLLGNTDAFSMNPELLHLLPYAAPITLGAICVTIIIGPSAAALTGLLASALYALMQANSMDIFIISFTTNLTCIYLSRNIRLRKSIIQASTMGGLLLALGAIISGTIHFSDPGLVGLQVIVAVVVSVISSFVIIGILPYIERIFNYTTNITLLEYTDYNNPLLRKLQMEAPGTYHHSLMVANLAERAANEIDANPLLCHATSLYHDIGKITKPEYFVENQRDGYNPHLERNPTVSALIIKNHVKEGASMAKEAKLPKIFIDVIKQHHGTTLIKYFYHKALERSNQPQLELKNEDGNAVFKDHGEIDENTFRYDGPKPRFKESAIIFFADAIEAASRTLKKITTQNIEELIDRIVDDRLQDHQLDDAPLTLQEIKTIKKSFAFTLLNMLHPRIEYPMKPEKK